MASCVEDCGRPGYYKWDGDWYCAGCYPFDETPTVDLLRWVLADTFSDRMKAKLDAKAEEYGDSFLSIPTEHLKARLRGECHELLDALDDAGRGLDGVPDVIEEAVDVANLAAMLDHRYHLAREEE